jgi:hypothetical protein
MPHRFVISDQGQLYTFGHVEDIPAVFDHMIEFAPEIPPGPHSDAQHDEIDRWDQILHELMRRERASSGKTD